MLFHVKKILFSTYILEYLIKLNSIYNTKRVIQYNSFSDVFLSVKFSHLIFTEPESHYSVETVLYFKAKNTMKITNYKKSHSKKYIRN